MKKKFGKPMGLKWRIENDAQKREEAILNDVPARFEIRQRPSTSGLFDWREIYTRDSLGKKAVQRYDDKIHKYSEKHNIDPDIIRSVMYAENARGHKYGINDMADSLRKSESVMPMNIQKNRWAPLLGNKPEDLYDPEVNIEASALLLKRIANRIDKPTAEKIGSIWHNIGHKETDDFGEYIGRIFREKPWREIN